MIKETNEDCSRGAARDNSSMTDIISMSATAGWQ